ncbi:Na+/H+ antiporter, partial [Klebsiella pneumoniae]|nr:Na+/H+ antiporter [Klebsiella pneumoniae]
MTRYIADELPHDNVKDDIGALMTDVAINSLNALLDEPVEDPSEQALRADAGNMLLETSQRRLHYIDNDEGQDVGLELAKRARLEKYM